VYIFDFAATADAVRYHRSAQFQTALPMPRPAVPSPISKPRANSSADSGQLSARPQPISPAATVGATLGTISPNINAFVQGTVTIAASSMPPMRFARSLVSGSKHRFKDDKGFDLDLTYILPRVVALGLPSSGMLEPLYRNPLSEVRRFFDTYHPKRYTLVNLCDERDYADDDFPDARILRFPHRDHHPPALSAIVGFCRRLQAILDGDPDHVVAVHCKAGKGRTGVMICSYLLWCGLPECGGDAQAAIALFRARRTTDGDACVQPSQCRYVHLFNELRGLGATAQADRLQGRRIRLLAVGMSHAPAALRASGLLSAINTMAASWHLQLDLACVRPVETADGVSSGAVRMASLPVLRCEAGSGPHRLDIPGGLAVCGELRLTLLDVGGLGLAATELAWLHIHTGFLPPDSSEAMRARAPPGASPGSGPPDDLSVCTATYSRQEVDLADKDPRFPHGWELTLYYQHESDTRGGGAMPAGVSVPCLGARSKD
tara:strand:- start:199 stop:1668 length:1470 start_codon:yes stop_codon:yes gene_type:complete